MKRLKGVDKTFLITVIILVIVGFFIFLSASLGITAKGNVSLSSIILNQLALGLFLGSFVAYIISRIKYTSWKKYSLWIFIASIILTLLVFIPGIGREFNGATRWIFVGPLSFQPSEFLKIAFVLYFATWLSNIKHRVGTIKYGVIPLVVIVGIAGGILLAQPDTDTFIVLSISALAMFWTAGGKFKHIILLGLIGVIAFGGLIATRPYIKDRIYTYINPASDSLGSGWQIQQSLIAVGSGGINGRGFGQSLQKFNFLPEPIGDSIFAVAAEEFGFLGAGLLIALFSIFAIRGLKIATNMTDSFGGLVIVGLVILITAQSFMNIGSMLGIVPLSGLPLIFVSHGGTALFFSLVAVGIILNVSRYQDK